MIEDFDNGNLSVTQVIGFESETLLNNSIESDYVEKAWCCES